MSHPRLARMVAHVLLAVGLGALLVAAPGLRTEPAEAISATSFDPGMIITDARFYNGSAMTAAEVQAFLNLKVPVCKDTNLSNDITCLKDYRASTYAITANANCAAIPAGDGRSAAEIIDMVARACGVSQKVLLATLQKEQGLVTHTDPGARRYEIAMGYACPDTAPCDPTKGGFFRQVYLGAWQFKEYAASPSNYSYRAGEWNSIGFKPDSACGHMDVYIQNTATAALYNYTPYVPNQAALNAGYGTGDTCSSYGNRNFFLFYGDWFGDPRTPEYPVMGGIYSSWQQHGGYVGIGMPTAAEVYIDGNGGGWYQRFEKGTIYVARSGATAYLTHASAISLNYLNAGGPSGTWGWPLGDESLVGGVPTIEFENLTASWSAAGLAVKYKVRGGLYSAWQARGGAAVLGEPTSTQTYVDSNGGGWYQPFARGTIYVAKSGSAAYLSHVSALALNYLDAGGPAGSWGWPLGDEKLVDGVPAVEFDNVLAAWIGNKLVVGTRYVVQGGINTVWKARGGLVGPGMPTAAEVSVSANGGGWTQTFQYGTVYVPRTGPTAYLASGAAITQAYLRAGGPAGAWGWPLTDQLVVDGVTLVEFQNVRVAYKDGAVVVGFPFADISDNPASSRLNSHSHAVWWMAEREISTGWAGPLGPEYRPYVSSGRYAIAAFLYRWAQPDFEAPATPTFRDVAASNGFYTEIEWLASTGISTGWVTAAGAEFRPESNVTREQLAAFLYRMAAPVGYVAPATSPFVDVPTSSDFYTEISWLASVGITTGWSTASGTEFRPASPVLRDQIAAFLYRFDALVS